MQTDFTNANNTKARATGIISNTKPGNAEQAKLKPTELKINGTQALHTDIKPLQATQT